MGAKQELPRYPLRLPQLEESQTVVRYCRLHSGPTEEKNS